MYYEYDENGYFIGMGGTKFENTTAIFPPSQLLKPRWNGFSWEEAATQEEIETVKTMIQKPIKSAGQLALEGLEALKIQQNLVVAELSTLIAAALWGDNNV